MDDLAPPVETREAVCTTVGVESLPGGDMRSEKAKKGGCKNLREEVMQPQNWPTASTRDHKGGYTGGRIRNGKVSMDTLDVAVQAHTEGGLLDQAKLSTNGKNQGSWSTPQARDWKGAEGRAYKGQTKDLPAQTEATGKLNPNWVEQLMGITVGWTDLGYWETESFQQQQLKHSSHLSKE